MRTTKIYSYRRVPNLPALHYQDIACRNPQNTVTFGYARMEDGYIFIGEFNF
jgi:hypothetical protein